MGMRFFTFVILSCFIFLAAPESSVAERTTVFESPAKALVEILQSADAGAIAFQQVSLRTPSKQYRTVPGIHPGYLDLPSSVLRAAAVAGVCPDASSHFIPISLKLLFPKHYFW